MNTEKKPRKHSVLIEVTPEMEGGALGFDKNSGQILIRNSQGNLLSTEGLALKHYYAGDNRLVQLSRLVAGPKSSLKGLSDLDFLATYDLIYIIDTNELKEKGGKVHHITSFLRCSVTDLGTAHKIDIYERVGYFHFINLEQGESEKAGWINLFNSDFFKSDLESGLKIGVLVDSYLDQLSLYNSRATPIIEQHFLPEGVVLMYAKADKQDTPVNKLIRASDRLANLYKKRILTGEIQLLSQKSPLFKCESYWFTNEKRSGLSFDPNVVPKSNLIYSDNASVSIEMFGGDADRNELLIRKKLS